MKKMINKLLSRLRGDMDLAKFKKRGLTVGDDFVCMSGVIIDPSHCWHIKIGNNVTLAPRVHILAHDTSTKLFLNHTRVANVSIGNDVFIGANVTILDGVSIGDGAVIGAGAVVSKDIPPYAIAVGAPIKILRYRFPEDTICKLHNLQWWNMSEDKLPLVEQNFFDIDKFIAECEQCQNSPS